MAIIGILTDFGNDFAVASIKGTILKGLPDATIVDIDHSIEKFSIESASFVIAATAKYFPENSLFICVVDPGVGGAREALCVITVTGQVFFGPNNGIFSDLFKSTEIREVFVIDEQFLTQKSNTFHGRDVFAPAVVAWLTGDHRLFKQFNVQQCVFFDDPSDRGKIVYIDSFGNLKTSLLVPKFLDSSEKKIVHIILNNLIYEAIFTTTFGTVPSETLIVYCGSNQTIEIAANLASAQHILGAHIGDSIELKKIEGINL
jgi:hypothetical protein